MSSVIKQRKGALAGAQPAVKSVSLPVVAGLIRCIDIGITVIFGITAHFLYIQYYLQGTFSEIAAPYLLVVGLAALIQGNIFHFSGLYKIDTLRELSRGMGRVFLFWTLVIVFLVATAFLTKTSADYSRAWVLIWYGSGLIGFITVRISLGHLMRQWVRSGRLCKKIAIVGGGLHGQRLFEFLSVDEDYFIYGFFDERADTGRIPEEILGYPRLGTVDDLLIFARQNPIDEIILALPWTAEHRLLSILQKIRPLPIDIRLSPDLIGYRVSHGSFSWIGSVPFLNLISKPLSDWRLFSKDAEDWILGTLMLIFIMPLLLLIALAIKIDSRGPVLFRQKRYGFNNEIIEIYKFRTLYHEQQDEFVNKPVDRGDTRITRIGSLLRNWSLDELPQFINVLKGEMSIVGPRPHAVYQKLGSELLENVVKEYASRHRVKPGITGWAQINGWRGALDHPEKLEKRVQHDLYYIENWSIGFDIKIILLTFFALLKAENAY